ncbi:MAG: hypothetical protein M3162_04915 [Thermoproteota archaeon]|nr:hypothetical protein [Thermoproteota archaeon]
MSPQGIVTKIIVKPIKTIGKSLRHLVMLGLVSLFGMLSISSLSSRGIMVYAQQQLIDPMSEALNEAQRKVVVATSPGAFGHGVPGLYNIPVEHLLMAFGISAAIGILVYMAVQFALGQMTKKMVSYQ